MIQVTGEHYHTGEGKSDRSAAGKAAHKMCSLPVLGANLYARRHAQSQPAAGRPVPDRAQLFHSTVRACVCVCVFMIRIADSKRRLGLRCAPKRANHWRSVVPISAIHEVLLGTCAVEVGMVCVVCVCDMHVQLGGVTS